MQTSIDSIGFNRKQINVIITYMDNYSDQIINKLMQNPLFKGIRQEQMRSLLNDLRAKTEIFEKDSYIFLPGHKPDGISILLFGGAVITRLDINGNEVIINKLKPGEVFAEVFACSDTEMPVSVIATDYSGVMEIPIDSILSGDASNIELKSRLTKNLLRIVAKKAIFLNERIEILSSRTIQQKIMKYLTSVSRETGSIAFRIPYNRNQLATFLAVDRSALSRELGKLKDEGIIDFEQNNFTLL